MRHLACLLLLQIPLTAADQWIRLTTPHFEMYTSASESKGREAILYFEEVRSFFLQASPSKHAPDFPVRIIAFRGEKQYRPYRINDFAIAFYTGSHDRDYIVMQDISSEHYPAAIHEYTHLIIRHSGLPLPVWMNEGWAELYSTLRPVGNKARIGDLKPGWLQTLGNEKWLPLQVLTSADHKSSFYNERDKAGIFYAESWALMHMLYFDDRYRPHFNQFVAAVASGKSFQDASQMVFATSMLQVEKDLKSYFTSRRLYAAIVDVKLTKSEEEATLEPVTDLESRLKLADLLVVTSKNDQARQALNDLLAQNPTRPEIQESLAYLAWQNGDTIGAREHFGKAFDDGTQNPQACYHYALLDHSEKSVDALQRAVRLKPDFTDAWMQLGFALDNRQDYQGAVAAFNHIKKVTPDHASQFFGARAYALAKTGNFAEARKNAEDARKWAKSQMDTEQAASILRYLDGVEASRKNGLPIVADAQPFERDNPGRADVPPKLAHRDPPPEHSNSASVPTTPRELLARVEGRAQNLECEGGRARISVLTDHGIMKFDILNPERVTIRHSSEATHEFTCGPQHNYPITVEYLPAPETARGVAGIARVLEF